VAKQKTSYRCSNCEHKVFKWAGCCPSCQEWNSFTEEAATQVSGSGGAHAAPLSVFTLDQIKQENVARICSGVDEWDRVLGGGIVPGSFLLLTGDPGIGKSTLLLQIASCIAESGKKVLYFSSEESLHQVKNRAIRLCVSSENLFFSDKANIEGIISTGAQEKPDLLIIDSIQNSVLSASTETLSIPGTVSQLREAGFRLMRFAKEAGVATIATGHVTKQGMVAGPRVLEHVVDGLFYLQGEDRWGTRMLRTIKNRFGTINELGFFEMQENGLNAISNINKYLMDGASNAPGSVLVCSVEGSRPLLLELQALSVSSKFGMPQRIVTGADHKRVSLIAAILEKYLHIKFSAQDIFFKVSGSFSVKESAADLGIALALLSSYFQKTVPSKSIVFGEVNLAGHVRATNHVDLRVREAEKFGIKQIFVAQGQNVKSASEVMRFKNVYDLLKLFPEGD